MSNISADDLGRVILTDISRNSVCRAESKSAASLLMTSRMFFETIEEEIRHTPGLEGLCFLSYRQDATHHRLKKSTLELEVGFLALQEQPEPRVPFMQIAKSLRQLSDVLNVEDETGSGTLAFTAKALSSLGCPFVDTFLEWNKCPGCICM